MNEIKYIFVGKCDNCLRETKTTVKSHIISYKIKGMDIKYYMICPYCNMKLDMDKKEIIDGNSN
jgi:hypothetical protein